jgi:ribosomal protein L9
METILVAIGIQVLSSVSSGITWDAIKLGAQTAIDKFKKAFTKKAYFKDEEQAEAYLEKIASEKSYNMKKPYIDACNIYSSMTDKDTTDAFQHDLEAWIIENKDELFKNPGAVVGSNVASVTTGSITAKGASSVTISVNQS